MNFIQDIKFGFAHDASLSPGSLRWPLLVADAGHRRTRRDVRHHQYAGLAAHFASEGPIQS